MKAKIDRRSVSEEDKQKIQQNLLWMKEIGLAIEYSKRFSFAFSEERNERDKPDGE